MICFLFVGRYCLRAKRVFSELNEKPFGVELDLRGIYLAKDSCGWVLETMV